MGRNYDPIAANQFRFGQAAMIWFHRDETKTPAQPYNGICTGILQNGLALNNAITKIDIPDTFSGGLGIAKTIITNRAPTLAATLVGFRSNIAQYMLHGETSNVAAVSANSKTLTVRKSDGFDHGIYLLDHPNVSAVAVTGAGGSPTYAVDADYTVNSEWGSINIVAGGQIAIDTDAESTDQMDIEVTYDAAAFVQIDANTTSAPELWLRLEGVDAANDNEPWVLDVFKVTPDILSNMVLVNNDVMRPVVNIPCVADGSRPTGSPYYRFWFPDGT